MDAEVIIVGGGIAGLAAAFELASRQVPFVLLESSSRLGGLILTERVDGCTLEAGADSLLVQKPAALELCDELGLTNRLISTMPPRVAFVHARGTLYALPSPSLFGIPANADAVAHYDLLSPAAREELLRRAALRPAPAVDADESVADFFRRQFGPETVALIAEPLLGGIHAGDVERLSIASVAPRLTALEREHGGVMRGLFATAPRQSSEGLFRSLPGGMGEIVAALLARLPADAILRNAPAVRAIRHADRWEVQTPAQSYSARAMIVSAPAHAAAKLLAASAPDAAALCARVEYVSTASVSLSFPRAAVTHPLAGSGFVVARQHSSLRLTACSWVTSKWAGRAPADVVLLRAFVGGAHDPDAVHLTDDSLVEIAERDLAPVLGIRGAPTLTRVHRWIAAGAQHQVGHRAAMAQLQSSLARVPGAFVAGSGCHAIGIPDCVADGRAAAAAAADYVKMLT